MEEAEYSVLRAQRAEEMPWGISQRRFSWRRMPLNWALKKDFDQTRIEGEALQKPEELGHTQIGFK